MRKIYAALGNLFTDSWSWQSFVSSFNCFNFFFSSGCIKWNTAATRMFYYSWLVCSLGFSLTDAPLVGNPNSQSIVSIKNELLFTLLDAESWKVSGDSGLLWWLSGPASYLPGFSRGTAVSPSPQKPRLPNSKSTRNQVDEEPLIVVDASPLNY